MSDTTHIKSLSSDGTQGKFDEKMHDMALKQIELDTQNLAQSLQVPYVSLTGIPIPPGPLSAISEKDARKFLAVCFAEAPGEKRIAIVDPACDGLEDFLKDLEEKTHTQLSLFLMSRPSFDSVLKLYSQIPKISPDTGGVEITEADLAKFSDGWSDIRNIQERLVNVSLTEMITVFVAVALKSDASDIHIEAEEKDVKARLRIDGTLHDLASLPPDSWKKIISRIKLLAGLKLNIDDRPQDGRFTIFLKNDEVDVRVSTLPTHYGESVVMRILRSSSAGLSFDSLGLSPYAYQLLKKEIDKPNGMVITTGPTGSGKTTTLYAILNYLNSSEIKIITLEDPVEYKLKGINQSQIDPSHNYTFASGLRSLLRQDPDVVMVGEIRDAETADIAINAALTGHIVLSTIHTNSAAGAIPRFLAMGVKGFLLSPALNAVMGQRLVRRLCAGCKREEILDEETLAKVTEHLSTLTPLYGVKIDMQHLRFWKSDGCEQCHGVGYKGRIGIYEILTITPEIEQQILSDHASESAVQISAVKNGMVTMVQDGLLRALEGITSVEEVFSIAD